MTAAAGSLYYRHKVVTLEVLQL